MKELQTEIIKTISLIEEKIKTEKDPNMLLILKDKYMNALKEIESSGVIQTNLNDITRLYLESYSDYMDNPLIDAMGNVSKLIKEFNKKTFASSRYVQTNIGNNILKGQKTPHNISQIVICENNSKYFLASFVFFYTRQDIESGMINRPTMWTVVDIENGEIIEIYETKDKEFSDASYDTKYNICSDTQYDTSKEYYDKAFAILDEIRQQIISEGMLNREKYGIYLNMILANIPKEYKRFYLDLSI